MDQKPRINEYLVLSENCRHQDNSIFKYAAVFFAITGALAKYIWSIKSELFCTQKLLPSLAGLLITAFFWVTAEPHFYRWRSYMKRAVELEPELGFSQYSRMPELHPKKVRPGLWAWRALYGVLAGYWTYQVLDCWLPTNFPACWLSSEWFIKVCATMVPVFGCAVRYEYGRRYLPSEQ